MSEISSSTKRRAAVVTRRYGGVDAGERRRERQRRLLDAGLAIFGTRGYPLSTVRDVCVEARLTERYFYESFKSLGELFDAVYAELRSLAHQRVMAAVITQGLGPSDPLAMGESALRAWYTFLHEDPRRAHLMLTNAVHMHDHGMHGAEAAIDEFKDLLRTFVSQLYPDISAFGMHPDLVVAGLAGATIYTAKTWAQSAFTPSIDEVLAHNMLIFRSFDKLYRQMETKGSQSPQPGSTPYAE